MRLRAFALIAVTLGYASSSAGRAPASSTAALRTTAPSSSSIAARTAGLGRRDGFLPLYLDERGGKLLIEIPRDSTRALYFLSQATGLGSNPVGVDRGGDGGGYVARFERNAGRVLLVLENWSYRSSAGDTSANARTVVESFPPSTVAAMPIVAEEGGRMLVDATDFLLQDWNDVSGTVSRAGQGSYALARERSSVYVPRTKAFPRNTEVEVALTFAGTGPAGALVRQILPDACAFTVRQHASFVALPDGGYRPRALDPRVGFVDVEYKDYAQPIQSPLVQRLATRFPLERTDPADPNSPIRNPIVYYVDRGIPEPVRTATKQGVAFWVDVFDEAGLKGAFRVEDLPEGADPLDARYNVVQWVNRNERGWSIGGSETDPRTGEIVKGMARMDSHRARTDYNLYAGLVGADSAAADTAFVLARVRQVSAHEVGHTLGLAHNYIASTYGDRGSVMDYPPPRVTLTAQGEIDLSAAYAPGAGDYDVWAIRWGYGIFPEGSERDSLSAIAAEGLRKGYLFLSDDDARPDYASDPRTNLWDDAATATEFLRRQTAVRRVAMGRAVADRLLALAADTAASAEVRAMVEYKIAALRDVARSRSRGGDDPSRAHWSSIAGDFTRWIERRELPRPTPALTPPPGDPFGVP